MHVPQTEVILRHDGAELARVTLPPGEYVIGRSAQVEIFANTPLLSRKHARLTLNYDDILLEDLGSSNGTFVADKPVTGATRLFPNQTVRLGDVALEIHRQRVRVDPSVSLAPAQATLQRVLPPELLAEKRYAIGPQIAAGGMGAILDAREGPTKRNVAMKVMLNTADEADVLRFIEEAQVTAQLDHPNIVPIHELGVNEHGQPFYTMKLVRGITLKKVLDLLAEGVEATRKKYPLPALLTIFQKACDAVAFAHAKGVIHRDLKPENIMLGDFGSVLVMDWGLAKVLQKNAAPVPGSITRTFVGSARAESGILGSTMSGTIMGTPQYMSPEQARGEVETLDARSDVFALGAIFFHLLHLRPLLDGTEPREVVERVARGEFDWTPPKKPAPAALLAVCHKAVALDRDQRYATVEDFQRDVTAYQAGFATSAEKAGAWKQLTLLVKRHQVVFSSAAAAAIIVAAVVAVSFQRIAGERNVAVGERRTATKERDRAETALTNLAKTAPTFAAMATGLVEQGNLEEALIKIGYAVSLDERNPDYLLRQANLLQATQKLNEAAKSYRAVLTLRLDPAAQVNLDLCEKLLRKPGDGSGLTLESQGLLLEAMLKQNRAVEAAPLSKIVGRDSETARAAILARLKPLLTFTGPGGGVGLLPNGTFRLSLGQTPIAQLPPLGDLPISEVLLLETRISDLTPLKGLRLRYLDLRRTPVSDLAPLAGMPMEWLDLAETNVTKLTALEGMPLKDLNIRGLRGLRDIKPLAGMPLQTLNAYDTFIMDLSPLRGLPLREVSFHGLFPDVPDFSPLAHSPTLEKISLPWKISDIAFLTTLPRLQQVECTNLSVPVWIPARDFLAKYGPEVPEIKAAHAALGSVGIKDLPIWKIFVDTDHLLHLELSKQPLADLEPLRGLPIVDLNLMSTMVKVSDLEPLRGMPIKKLVILNQELSDLGPLRGMAMNEMQLKSPKLRDLNPLRGMPIHYLTLGGELLSDLEPLRGMPLVSLCLRATAVRDVALLADFPDLEELVLPEKATNIERLRTLPKLGLLSFKPDGNNRPTQTAAQFWKEYDAQQAATKK